MKIWKLAIALTMICLLCGCGKQKPAEQNSGAAAEPAVTAQSQNYAFNAQYIRTGSGSSEQTYPMVIIIRSQEELQAYYQENRDLYNLERRNDPGDPMGFLDVCDQYDEAYFQEHFLMLVLLEEGSGSITHKVDQLTLEADGNLTAFISSQVPEVGTADMALWHILIEPEAGVPIPKQDRIRVNLDGVAAYENAKSLFDGMKAENGSDMIQEDQGILEIQGVEYVVSDEDCKVMVKLLNSLQYSPGKVCKCLPEYSFRINGQAYGIHLSEGYARCSQGQASLTQQQNDQIRQIVEKFQQEKTKITEQDIKKLP